MFDTPLGARFVAAVHAAVVKEAGRRVPGITFDLMEVYWHNRDVLVRVNGTGGPNIFASIRLSESDEKFLSGEYHVGHSCPNKRPRSDAFEKLVGSVARMAVEMLAARGVL